MRYIGIDVAKATLAVFIPSQGNLTVTNDEEGFRKLVKELKKDDVVGVESTGSYHHPLARFLIRKGFEVRELNPIMTKQFIRATVRRKKTDKTDAVIISKLLAQGDGHPMTLKNIDNPLKKMSRVREKLVQARSSLKLQLQTVELDLKVIRRSLKTLIKKYDQEIEKIDAAMLETKNEQTAILESVPGVSPRIARSILAELGDVKRFSNKKKITAFAGYDPKLTESGSSIHHTGKLTKRGSPYLRHVLHLAAFANTSRSNIFSDYYRKKKSEGKHFYQSMTATARKMLEIIYTLLINGEHFKP